MNEIIEEYRRRHSVFLDTIAQNLKEHIQSHLTDVSNIDRVTARAKNPESFTVKALRTNDDGSTKYRKPLTEIQDQLGSRVIVFFRNDVATVAETIKRYFQPIEQKELVPESQWAFGYFWQHFVLPLPIAVVSKNV